MTVHVLNTPLQLPKPDLTVVMTCRTQLKRNANALSDFYLPVIRETLTSLIKELGAVDKEALHMINTVPGLLKTAGLPVLIETLGQMRQDPEKNEGEAIAQVVTEIEKSLQAVSTGLSEHARSLDNALMNFDAVSFGDVEALPAPIQAEIDRINVDIALIEAPLAKLREEEATLKKLIVDLEALNVFDKLKPLAESLKQLVDIDPKNPLVGSIKAGIQGTSNILDLASEALHYEHLVKRRTSLQEQLDSIEHKTRTLRLQLDKQTADFTQLQLLQGMQTSRNEYGQELGKLREALKRFIDYAFNDTDITEQRVSRFTQYAGMLSTYMDELHREWQSRAM